MLPEPIPQQNPNSLLRIPFSSMVSTNDNPKAEQAILLISAVQRYPPYVGSLKALNSEQDDAICIFATHMLFQRCPLEFYRSGQFDAQLKKLPGRAIKRIDEALLRIFDSQRA
jgi:hypothetical protein